ncbi:MAG: hypothetical protein IJV84_00240 [Bacteroidales bacterium]|nr:hypothetical protein [Bacteroidales bacterium]
MIGKNSKCLQYGKIANIMSKEFESLSMEKLTDYIDGNTTLCDELEVVKSIKEVEDLWILAKMSLDYDKDM